MKSDYNDYTMKKLLLVLVVVAMFAVGCQTFQPADSWVECGAEVGATLTISLAQTRISMGGKIGDTYPVNWSEGDKIVVNGTLSDEVQIDADNRSWAKFTVNPLPVAPLCITYPYCEATSAERPIVDFPAEQEYVEGTFASGSAPMCGSRSDFAFSGKDNL